jgi:hypothetical protein
VNLNTEERRKKILKILSEAAADPKTLQVIWLLESGRGISASVQGGFLDLVGARK